LGQQRGARMQLRSLLTLVAGVVGTLVFLAVAIVFQANLRSYHDDTSEHAVRVRAQALGVFLTRTLYEEWRRVESSAQEFSGADLSALQARLDAVAGSDDKVSWMGVAAPDGTILASTGGLLSGESVAWRPWFQQGLSGPFAGDVHQSVLLARLLDPAPGEPLRFVDFSAPIVGANNQVLGVLGAHVNWRWVREVVAEAALQLELDAFVVNREGTVVLSTDSIDESSASLPSFEAARRGVTSNFTETWPDGTSYYSFTLPNLVYADMPPFGWGLVARLDESAFDLPERKFQRQMLAAGGVVWFAGVAIFAFVAGVFIRPLRRLSSALLSQSRGEPTDYIRQHRRTAEVQVLSEALARFQASDPTARPPPRN
jgi:hypothetical protein